MPVAVTLSKHYKVIDSLWSVSLVGDPFPNKVVANPISVTFGAVEHGGDGAVLAGTFPDVGTLHSFISPEEGFF